MSETPFTVLDDGRALEVAARVADGRVLIPAAAFERAVGWKLEPQGLCRGDVCVPVPNRARVVRDGQIDLEAFARLIDRPLALDLDERAASLGACAREHARALQGGVAPDFALPDLAGGEWTLGGLRGKKVLLIAHASW